MYPILDEPTNDFEDESGPRQDWLRSIDAACDAEDTADPPTDADYARLYQLAASPLVVTDVPLDADGGRFAVWRGDDADGDDEFDYMQHE